MARRYDRIGAAFRAVYDRAAARAPRPPVFSDLQAAAEVAPASRPVLERPLAALLIAGLVVVVVGAAAFILTGDSEEDQPPAAGTTLPTDEPTPTGEQPPVTGDGTTVAPATTEAPLLLRSAPWSSDPLPASDVDPILQAAWEGSGNRGWCSLLAPVSLGPEGEEATAREANFGTDAWAVAWDRPAGPGMLGNSSQCGDCGRSAFGIAGVGPPPAGGDLSAWPNVVEWADGSVGGYGPGDQGATDEPPLGHRHLGEIAVVGQACPYQVWSNLGEDHLTFLVAQMRFVEGHQSDPVEVRVPGGAHEVVIDGGDPPWAQPSVPASGVSTVLVNEWRGSAAATPLVVIEGVAEELPEARIRSANLGAWGVAWDNPAGPGHDSSNNPCAQCGRGVIGLSGVGGSATSGHEGPAHHGRIDWNDGSFAVYDLYLGSNGLPVELMTYTDPETGEEVSDGWQALVEIEGTDSTFTVWSHLGEDHLIDLLTRMRFVDIAP